jgi:RNA 2',3'-cyclic 3'-phosphodiesterase
VRAFVAVPWEGAAFGSAPPRPAPEHLTLHFLGEIAVELVPGLVTQLRAAVGGRPAFDLTVEGIGAFPSRERPRVVWRGIGAGRDELVRLAEEVRRADVAAGAPGDPRPFAPHLTLFRVRSPADAARARELLDGRALLPPPERVRVREVHLLESLLRPGGAVHHVLERFPLAD